MAKSIARPADERVNWITSIPFFAVHLPAVLAVFTGVTAQGAVVLGVVLYAGRMFFITAGYHRYFSHRSYRLGRVLQFVMAFGGTTAVAEGAAVVGRPPPQPPPLLRHRARHPLAAEGVLVEPRRLDPVRQVQRPPTTTTSRTSPSTPSCASSTSTTGSRRGRSASPPTSIAGWSGLRDRVLRVDRPVVAHARSR